VAYSAEFRNDMIRKLTSPRGPSVHELAAKSGVHQTTLSRWVREGTTLRAPMSSDNDEQQKTRLRAGRRPQDFSPEEKLRIVQQAGQLEGAELAQFSGVRECTRLTWLSGARRPTRRR
jgi:transposase-like protein